MCLEFVRLGNKVSWLLASDKLLCRDAEHYFEAMIESLTKIDELPNEKTILIVVIIVRCTSRGTRTESSYLVDPASSHMLVSKIKPCMSKHKPLHGEAANGSLGHPWFIRSYNPTWITVVILELIHAIKPQLLEGVYLLDKKPTRLAAPLVIHNNFSNRMALCRRCFIQISALSTFDGRIEAYHGFNG